MKSFVEIRGKIVPFKNVVYSDSNWIHMKHGYSIDISEGSLGAYFAKEYKEWLNDE